MLAMVDFGVAGKDDSDCKSESTELPDPRRTGTGSEDMVMDDILLRRLERTCTVGRTRVSTYSSSMAAASIARWMVP